jgi:hypothetical protein
MVIIPLVVLPAAVGAVRMLLRRIAWVVVYLFPDYHAMLNEEGVGGFFSSGGAHEEREVWRLVNDRRASSSVRIL